MNGIASLFHFPVEGSVPMSGPAPRVVHGGFSARLFELYGTIVVTSTCEKKVKIFSKTSNLCYYMNK